MSNSLQEILFVFGQPVAGNPTQFMMERALAEANLDWRYLTLEVPAEKLADAIRGARAMNFRGGNITMPHKVAVIEHLDELSQAAQLMQAVNCIHHHQGRLLGENTDGKGFLQSLREVRDPAGTQVTILGAGGAARAIAVELALAQAGKITIVNRTPSRGEELAAVLREKVHVAAEAVGWEKEYEIPPETEILINGTSIGLFAEETRVPVKRETLRPNLVVADVVFSPPETRFLQEAKAAGATTLDGLGMLVNQAVIGFQIWTGVTPNAATMREALEEYLSL
ncbi:MAG: shikimate dehydrogenase [Pirellulales bacterium]|nr:shikimate dehydrogenase [Pirellulales bacterium]